MEARKGGGGGGGTLGLLVGCSCNDFMTGPWRCRLPASSKGMLSLQAKEMR